MAKRQQDSGSGPLLVLGLALLALSRRNGGSGGGQLASATAVVGDIAVSQNVCLHIQGNRLLKTPGENLQIRAFYIPNARNAQGVGIDWPFRVRSLMASRVFVNGPGAASPLSWTSGSGLIDAVVGTSIATTWAGSAMGTTVNSLEPNALAPPFEAGKDMVLDIGCAVQYLRPGGALPGQEADWIYAKDSLGQWAAAVLNDAIEVVPLTLQAGVPSFITVAQQRQASPGYALDAIWR